MSDVFPGQCWQCSLIACLLSKAGCVSLCPLLDLDKVFLLCVCEAMGITGMWQPFCWRICEFKRPVVYISLYAVPGIANFCGTGSFQPNCWQVGHFSTLWPEGAWMKEFCLHLKMRMPLKHPVVQLSRGAKAAVRKSENRVAFWPIKYCFQGFLLSVPTPYLMLEREDAIGASGLFQRSLAYLCSRLGKTERLLAQQQWGGGALFNLGCAVFQGFAHKA